MPSAPPPRTVAGDGCLHLYRLRHGGASRDFSHNMRSLQEVQSRGRWWSPNSVRRYQKGGRLAQLFNLLPADVRSKAIAATEALPATLRGLHS